ncbi:MAG: DinB family protein [Anaerolineae bacterium]
MIETPYGPVHLDHCHPYLRDEIALLGDADPFASQRALPDRLTAALDGLPDAALDFRPAPTEWSAREVVAHLVQSEIVYGYRYRAILAEPETAIAGYDQERWTTALPESRWPLGVLLGHLRALKNLNVSVLEQTSRDERAPLEPPQRARQGEHRRPDRRHRRARPHARGADRGEHRGVAGIEAKPVG